MNHDGQKKSLASTSHVMIPAWSESGKQIAFIQKDGKKFALYFTDVQSIASLASFGFGGSAVRFSVRVRVSGSRFGVRSHAAEMKTARWKSLACAVGSAAFAVGLRAQQPAQQPPTFRSGTQVVEVDVRVFDKDGRSSRI